MWGRDESVNSAITRFCVLGSERVVRAREVEASQGFLVRIHPHKVLPGAIGLPIAPDRPPERSSVCGYYPRMGIARTQVVKYAGGRRNPLIITGESNMAGQRDTISGLGFQPRKGFVHPDARGRLTLGSAAQDADYRVLVNEKGQILLDPVIPIPASEAWLWANPALRASMERALNQAEADGFEDLGSFAQFASEDD